MARLRLGSPQGAASFEAIYLDVRQKEGRLLTIQQLQSLPDVTGFRHQSEWRERIRSASRLINYLQGEMTNILDVGCGNGWLSYLLAREGHDVTGVDINRYELEQASEAFDLSNLDFIYDDLFSPTILEGRYSHIILSSSLQYFSDLKLLFSTLLGFLHPEGEIHILNTPLYSEKDVAAARDRTISYYEELGFPEMAALYFHHTWPSIRQFGGKRVRQFWKRSIFPWVRIRARDLRRSLR